tara:strand:+ start:2212 stop:3057 length:846 start_codon:yes stop_codon:yes gene_type:complete
MLLPASLVFLVLFMGALIMAFLQSLGYAPIYGVNEFPTLSYYREMLADPAFRVSIGLTFYYALIPTILGTILSIYLALALRKNFRGRTSFQYIYKLPLMIPYLVGVAVVIELFTQGGIIARLFYAAGFIDLPSDFPRLLKTEAGWGIMTVYLWKQIPFTTLIVYSVLMGLGKEYEEAAGTLGANKRQTFLYVTLPQIMPGIVAATLIVFPFNFGSFEVPYILGADFPNTLPVQAWRVFDDADYTRRLGAMAIVMTISFISGIMLLIYLMLYRRYERIRGRQ